MRLILMFSLICACSPMVYDHNVPNLAQVNDSTWRSGQITTTDGWQYVQYLVRPRSLHVIKLNFDDEAMAGDLDGDDIASQMGIVVYRLPIEPAGDQGTWTDIADVFKQPDEAKVDMAEMLLSPGTSDVAWLVHCTHGQDRTGLVIGEHRVLHDGWSKDAAYQEMLAHNFHWELPGLHDFWEDWQP